MGSGSSKQAGPVIQYKAPEGTTCISTTGFRMLQVFVAVFMTVFALAALVGGLSDLALEGLNMGLFVAGVILTQGALMELSLNLESGAWYIHLIALILGIAGVFMVTLAALT